MATIGQGVKSTLRQSHARYFDELCDNMVWQNVTNVNEAKTLTIGESGTVILGAAVGTEQADDLGFNVYLPTPQRGIWYNFILRAPSIANNSNAAITVTATSDGSSAANIAIGNVRGHGDDQGANVVAVADTITFVKAKATAGDNAEIWCDGTNWNADIVYDAAASVTLA